MEAFCLKSWPEDPTPPDWLDCDACGLYKQGTRMIWGEGNPDAKVLVLLDNPGAREDREGNPFVCGTRQALQQAAQEVGFTPDDLYVTYVLKRRPLQKYDKDAARAACLQHLEHQLSQKWLDVVLCLGNIAVQSFFGDPHAEVKHLRQSWHDVRGIPTTVAYHPLAVRRRPNLWNVFLEDWRFLAERVKGMWEETPNA